MNRFANFSNAAKVIACSSLLVLPACQIPCLQNAESGPNLPISFDAGGGSEKANSLAAVFGGMGVAYQPSEPVTADSSALLRVEEFYNDPLLANLINQSLLNNRELKILDQEVQIASNDVLAAQGAYLPFVTVGSSGGFEKTSRYTRDGAVESQLDIRPGRSFPNPLWNTQTGLNLFWQLDIWRQLRNARDAAAQRYIVATEKRSYFVTRMVAEIAENYYRLVSLDNRLDTLDRTIALQQKSLDISQIKKDNARGTELPVQRFRAEVRKNQSEKLIINQEIIEVENRINFLVNRYPEPVERTSSGFFDLTIHPLSTGVPSQLLQNRPDIRQAERELAAAGLDVLVARARFYPSLSISAGVGYEAFNPRYLFNPEAFAANIAGGLVAPLINKKAIQADYLTANAKQLECIYNYQRVVLNAFTEVVNRVTMVENYRKSLEIKKQQLQALEASVETATNLFQNARAEYIEVLFAQRDMLEARIVMIETKKEQLSAVVKAYQALGGGDVSRIPNQNPPQVQR